MKVDRRKFSEKLFEQLEPPAGGFEAIRERIGESPSSLQQIWRPVVGLSSFALIAVWLVPMFVIQDPIEVIEHVYDSPQFDRLLGRETLPVALKVTMNDQPVPVAELAGVENEVRVYQLN